jgi:Ribosomal protein S21
LARNRVRYELRLAERHEKKGVKRRRLESERWRIRFADEVRFFKIVYTKLLFLLVLTGAKESGTCESHSS